MEVIMAGVLGGTALVTTGLAVCAGDVGLLVLMYIWIRLINTLLETLVSGISLKYISVDLLCEAWC